MNQNSNPYKVIISSEANEKMLKHFEFLGQVSINAANRLLDNLLNDISILQTDPKRYPLYNRPYLPIGKYRCLLSNKRYRIIYQIIGKNVYVDDIQDCRQNENTDRLISREPRL